METTGPASAGKPEEEDEQRWRGKEKSEGEAKGNSKHRRPVLRVAIPLHTRKPLRNIPAPSCWPASPKTDEKRVQEIVHRCVTTAADERSEGGAKPYPSGTPH